VEPSPGLHEGEPWLQVLLCGAVRGTFSRCAKSGDFEPLISEELFYRVQSVLAGRVPVTTPQQRAHPDFPLRAFVRCVFCGRGLTGSWSKGRSAGPAKSQYRTFTVYPSPHIFHVDAAHRRIGREDSGAEAGRPPPRVFAK
jgi:hypothetical protein